VEILLLRVSFHVSIVRHFFYYDTGSISCISELVLSVDVVFKWLWSRIRFIVEVITVGGGLPGFLGASCSGNAFSAPVVSVSMTAVTRGAIAS
jgi:hypothetical protein